MGDTCCSALGPLAVTWGTHGPHRCSYFLLPSKQRPDRSLSFERVVVFAMSSSPERGFGKMEVPPRTRALWLGLHSATAHVGVGRC